MSLKLKGRKVYLGKAYGEDKVLHGVITQDLIWVRVLIDGKDVVMSVEEKDLHFDIKKKGKGR